MNRKQTLTFHLLDSLTDDFFINNKLDLIKNTKIFHCGSSTDRITHHIVFNKDNKYKDNVHIKLIYWINKSGNIEGYGYDLLEKTIKPTNCFNGEFNFEKSIIEALSKKLTIVEQKSL